MNKFNELIVTADIRVLSNGIVQLYSDSTGHLYGEMLNGHHYAYDPRLDHDDIVAAVTYHLSVRVNTAARELANLRQAANDNDIQLVDDRTLILRDKARDSLR